MDLFPPPRDVRSSDLNAPLDTHPESGQFLTGLAHGIGLPASIPEAKSMLGGALGLIFGQPESWDALGQGLGSVVNHGTTAVQHPQEALSSAWQQIQHNPAGAIGYTMGMALPMPEKLPPAEAIPEQLAFGGR